MKSRCASPFSFSGSALQGYARRLPQPIPGIVWSWLNRLISLGGARSQDGRSLPLAQLWEHVGLLNDAKDKAAVDGRDATNGLQFAAHEILVTRKVGDHNPQQVVRHAGHYVALKHLINPCNRCFKLLYGRLGVTC